MKKSLALVGVVVCAGSLVLVGKIILTPRPLVDAASFARASASSAVNDSSSSKDASSNDKQSNKKDPGKDDKNDEGFQFPKDRGGQLLSQMLLPSTAPALELSSKKMTTAPSAIEQPALRSTVLVIAVPRLPLDPHRHNFLLGQIPEEQPFSYYQSDPPKPRDQSLPTGDRVRIASVDPNQPMPLPILAKPVSDRASLEDPTLEQSVEAAITAKMPVRVAPAPYLRMSLPNPFEFREAVQSKITVDEDPMPISATPQLPK